MTTQSMPETTCVACGLVVFHEVCIVMHNNPRLTNICTFSDLSSCLSAESSVVLPETPQCRHVCDVLCVGMHQPTVIMANG